MKKSTAPSRTGNGIFPNPHYVRSIQNVLSLLNKDDKSENIPERSPPQHSTNSLTTLQEHVFSQGNNFLHDRSENSSLISTQSNILLQYKVVWGKPSTKKHKTWDGDGFLEISDKSAILRDKDGSILGTKKLFNILVVEIGQILTIGSKVIEIIELCSDTECQEINKEKDTKKATLACHLSPQQQNKKLVDAIKIPENSSTFKKLNKQRTTNLAPLVQSTNTSLQFKVVWGKPSTKKHKTWDGDGFLEVSANCATLQAEDGTVLGTKNFFKPLEVEVGQILTIGSKLIEVIEPCSSIKCTQAIKRPIDDPEPVYRPSKLKKKTPNSSITSSFSNVCRPLDMKRIQSFTLPPPPESHQWKYNTAKRPICSVVVDSFLTLRLRPHQQTGLTFLYSCIMGYVNEHTGAILADEMGLGKTLQCIALIWTLLKHGPYGVAVIKRSIVITPSTLCGTWEKEFRKWLGRERLLPFVVDNSHKPQDFKARPNLPVMIISYERFVKHADEIESVGFDLIICDEAHRLKNANIKAAQALQNLSCKRRVLLTGTPIQNDLQEYFVLIDIANPGILGSYNDFKEEFVQPILISQKPDCSQEETKAGEHSAAHLQLLTSNFILRRTQSLLKDYLPVKMECVICCKITNLQETLYTAATDNWWNNKELAPSSPLSLIVLLKKICNYPHLIKKPDASLDVTGVNVSIADSLHKFLPKTNNVTEGLSGKLAVMKELMKEVVFQKKEKMVIVSCSTKMLDVLAEVCSKSFIKFSRLDGSTPVASRQSLVESFNCHGGSPVLLLSSRAGGTGLSLPSASRLVLYDSDWNPAVDHQAMARIWRDGQKRPVFIYRLLTTGTIEEKIYQRQMFKTGLSDAIIDPDNLKSTQKLCDTELKELFVANLLTESSTHDVLQCQCAGDGSGDHMEDMDFEDLDDEFACGSVKTSKQDSSSASMNRLRSWDHFRPSLDPPILQDIGLATAKENITFIFRKTDSK